MTKNADGKILKTEFKEELQARIISGRLKPGTRLPPERELANEFGISRGSVNQGILDLERAGFLRVVPRKGTFVEAYYKNPLTLSAILSYDSTLIDPALFRDLMSMRILIERECVRLACGQMNSSGREMLEGMTERLYCSGSGELPELLYSYHRGLVELSGNSAYALIFNSFELMLKNMISRHYSDPAELERCLPLYEKLSYAIQCSNTAEADRFITQILEHAAAYLNTNLSYDC